MNRRRFLQYAGATVAVVGTSVAAYYLYNTALGRKPEVTIPSATKTESTASQRVNHPPVANFKYKPHYLDPTDQQTIQFTSNCYDADNDLLQYGWSVDGEQKSTEKDYFTVLPVGEHSIQLTVSDGAAQNRVQQTVTVEPDQIYPTRPLNVKYKGARMFVGWKGMNHFPHDATEEKLKIIHDELRCNAVYIFGNTEFEDDLVEAGRIAIGNGFERIYIQPLYLDMPIDETVARIGEFDKKVKALREVSDNIVFVVGHEFTFDSYGLVPGETYEERLLYPLNHPDFMKKAYAVLPDAFRRIIALCKTNYGYQITYDATIEEGDSIVPWADPIFESVGTSAFLWDQAGWTEKWIAGRLSRLRQYGKPVDFDEWGCLCFKGAAAEFIDINMENSPYDENEQANYIMRYCTMVNKLNMSDKANVNAVFLSSLDDERLKGTGLYRTTNPPYFGVGSSRKKGFYMYKSYQRVT